MATTSFQLYHFDARSLVEVTRMMFYCAEQPYDDIRYPLHIFQNFAKPEFDAAKSAGKFIVNLDRLPILRVGDVTIGQSKAIERYVAKRLGFYGTSIEEEAHIDAICEHIRDIKDMYLAFKSSLKRFEESQSGRVMFLSRHLPLWLLKLEKVVAADGFCVGSRLSIADLNLFVFLTEYFDHVDIALESIKNSPKIQAILHSVLLRVQPWLEDRPLSLI